MADAIFHIKDGYYFEVPKFLWRPHYENLDEVPAFLRNANPEASLADFEHAMAGKILIPQPFGTLRNLHDRESGFAISKFMIIELVVAVLMSVIFISIARRIRHGEVPRGRLWNLFEAILVFLRDQIARPAIGGAHDDHGETPHGKQGAAAGHAEAHHGDPGHAPHAAQHPVNEADKFLPILWTMFFFILFCNLFGLVPWAGSPTASWAVTASLALVTFATGLIAGSIKFGPLGYWFNQVPGMEAPQFESPVVTMFFGAFMWLLRIVIFVIEVLGLLIRHAILSIRLLANMVAGHLVLLAILGMTTAAAAQPFGKWSLVMAISVLGSTLLSCLELFVAVLQAYVFTFLSALFIGAAVHKH